MIGHPLLRDCPNVFRYYKALLSDDEGFGNAVDPKVDANRACSVHPVREGLLKLTDKLAGGTLLVLNIHPNHDYTAIPEPFPNSLEARRLLIAGRVAP